MTLAVTPSSITPPSMTQMLLDLEAPLRPTFDNFVVGTNDEVFALLKRLTTDAAAPRFVYVWGEAGSGRSHLLRAACGAHAGRYLDAASASAAVVRDSAAVRPTLLAIDDVGRLAADAQEALFHAINLLRADENATVIVAGDATPRDVALADGRDDLRSRLAWGLVYRVERLDDADKDAALAQHAEQRGFPLAADVRRYLLNHFSRDLGSLMRMVDALDRHAREHRRVVTVPLIRDFLQQQSMTSEAA